MKNFLFDIIKHKTIRNIFVIAVLTSLAIPGYNLAFVFPSFQEVLIQNTITEAKRSGKHMARTILGDEMSQEVESLTEENIAEIGVLFEDYEFYKVRLFSPDGRFVYSTSAKEIGQVNEKPYFHQVVAKGDIYAQVVAKGKKSLEGDEIKIDVVEIYVPIMSGQGHFLGAFELYYDITDPIAQLARAHLVSVMELSVGALALLVLLGWALRKALQAQLELEAANLQLTKTQGQLVEAEKMASLGGLVAGIAHEVNTPIGIGVTAASFLREQTEIVEKKNEEKKLKKSEFDSFLFQAVDASCTILKNLERAADLINSFKQVAVDQSSDEVREFELCHYMRETLNSLRPKFKNQRHIVDLFCDETIQMESNPGAIAQVITNLTMNSLIHGFDGREEGNILVRATVANGTVHIYYRDDGLGMSQETQAKIFEPFFTTKRGQGGSGLGMHILYNLVTQSLQGKIEVQSALGKGTAFDIRLPLKIQHKMTKE